VRHSKYAADAHALFCEGLWQTPRMVAPGGGGQGGEEAKAAVDIGSAPHVLSWYHRWLLSSGLVGTSKRGIIVGQVGVRSPRSFKLFRNPRRFRNAATGGRRMSQRRLAREGRTSSPCCRERDDLDGLVASSPCGSMQVG
jgi:hypothetical protein